MADLYAAGDSRCPRCSEVLPAEALYCSTCGERMVKDTAPLPAAQDEFTLRYRKTSLLRRRPYVNLFLAVDSHRQRPVAMRDVDVSYLDEQGRTKAYEIIEWEYDLLRRLSMPIPLLMPAIDTGGTQDHLLTIMGDPSFSDSIHTLQNVLQSGIGLPKIAVALQWIQSLCDTLDVLHRRQIIIGDIDPRIIILKENDYVEMPMLLISWLPASLAGMLPPVSSESLNSNMTSFMSPEALRGKPDVRSDVYSLGALLYLLLTGLPPEDTRLRSQRRLRLPSELNTQVSGKIDRIVMQALSLDQAERYQSTRAMQEALAPFCSKNIELMNGRNPGRSLRMTKEPREDQIADEVSSAEVTWEHDSGVGSFVVDDRFDTGAPPVGVESKLSDMPVSEFPVVPTVTPVSTIDAIDEEELAQEEEEAPGSEAEDAPMLTVVANRADSEEILTRPLEREDEKTAVEMPAPARPIAEVKQREPVAAVSTPAPGAIPLSRALVPYRAALPQSKLMRNASRILRRVRDMLLGEQRLDTTAAAVIETPLRVMPDQAYSIRIQLMGRDSGENGRNANHSAASAKPAEQAPGGGITALFEGDTVCIQVRSAIYERYAYVVQQAEVTIPAPGYAAEVTIPMRPLSQGPSGRRDRLHIFFLDEFRRPLYEKPFVVELFISHRVQPGREGHNVLTIPV